MPMFNLYIIYLLILFIFSHKDKFVNVLEPINNGLHYIYKISQNASIIKCENLEKNKYIIKI